MSKPSTPAVTRSSTCLTTPVKDGIRALTNRKCWLCKVEGKQIAHLFDAADPTLLELYVEHGVVETTNINAQDNLICLCGTCHASFDLRTPAWAFLPFPLEPFLTAEQDFQIARRENPLAKRKRVLRRNMVFQPYLVREGSINFPPGGIGGPRAWHGDPVLAILRSYVLLQGLRRIAVEKGGVPQDVAEMYVALIGLYATAAALATPELGAATLVGVGSSVGAMGPPPSVSRPGKRRAETEEPSDGESVAVSTTTAQTNDTRGTGLDGSPLWGVFNRPSEAGSDDAASSRTGRSNDTQLTKSVPRVRPAKRARLTKQAGVSGVAKWVGGIAQTRRSGKGK